MNKNTKNKIIYWLVGLGVLVAATFGIKAWGAPSDFGLSEGDVISAVNSNDPDIYIVNDWDYKRLFLNPVIFNFYGHIGWDKVKNVSPATRDAFGTSGLFRVNGSEKVYGLESTGEDTGVLHWVNTTGAQAVADDANFFRKVFVINQNEFNWYPKGADYTSVNQIPSYSRGEVVPVSVNKASINGVIPSETITWNATGFEMLNVKFDGSGAVNSLTVKRLGFGDRDDYDNIYLYKNGVRLTNGKSFNSDNIAVFNVNLQAPFILSVVADFDGDPQNIAKVELRGSYNGLPLQSNNFTFASATSGNVTIDESGSGDTVVVGQKNAKVGEFKVTAGSENITLQKLYLYNTGSADVSNVKLVSDTTYTSSLVNDKYLFSLNTVIKSGKYEKFEVFADIDSDAKDGQDVRFIIEENYDVVALGNVYGFGVQVVNNLTANVYDVESNGTFNVVMDSNAKVQAVLFGEQKKTILSFSVEPEDEDFKLTDINVGGLASVSKVYLYKGDTLLTSESVDENVATLSFETVISDETDFTVKADIVELEDLEDNITEDSFVATLNYVVGTGVGSDKEWKENGDAGKTVYVYSAYPKFTNLVIGEKKIVSPTAWYKALEFNVTAVGDLKIASMLFNINEDFVADVNWELRNGSDVVASGSNAQNGTLNVVLDESLEITDGNTEMLTLYIRATGTGTNKYFKATLEDIEGSVEWFAKNSEGEYVSYTLENVVKVLKTLPLEGADLYRE